MSIVELDWFRSSYSGDGGDNCIEVALSWTKSTYSGAGGGNCVEVVLPWAKSSYSGAGGGDCVEVAACLTTVHIRDSKDTDRTPFTVAPAAWSAFIATL